MLHIYIALDNALNYVIVRDFDRDDNDAAIVDWDLSDDEIMTILTMPAEEFANEVHAADLEWEHWDLLAGSMTHVESADTWLERAAAEGVLI